MDPRAYGRSDSSLPTESSSGNSEDGVVVGPSSDTGTFLPQGPFPEDERRQSNWLQGTLNARHPQVNEEARCILSYNTRTSYQPTNTDLQLTHSGPYSYVVYTRARGIDGRVGTSHPENLINGVYEGNIPASHSMHSATASPLPTQV